jgi:hypothetical protein
MLVRDPIRAAQTELGLVGRDALFATLLDVSDDALQRARNGDGEARDTVVRAASLVLGIEPHELIFDGPEGRATTALLKTVVDPLHAAAFDEAAHQGLQHDLGRFVRRLRRKAWLREALGDAAPSLPPALAVLARPTPPRAVAPNGADALAVAVRDALELGDAPIASVVGLVRDRLQIELHGSRTLWSQVEGASYACGDARGILVGLHGHQHVCGIRVTLAHELCHVLFDGAFMGARHNGMLAFSPSGERASPHRRGVRRNNPATTFRLREQRAGSFAAYLLAPPDGVRAHLRDPQPPRSRATVDAVAEHFGLSRTAALNVVANVFGWNRDQRLDVSSCFEDAPPLRQDAWADDRLAAIGGRDDDLRRLADRAVKAHRLSPAEHIVYVDE